MTLRYERDITTTDLKKEALKRLDVNEMVSHFLENSVEKDVICHIERVVEEFPKPSAVQFVRVKNLHCIYRNIQSNCATTAIK